MAATRTKPWARVSNSGDTGLRIATTPSSNAVEEKPVGILDLRFGSMMKSFGHDRVARLTEDACRRGAPELCGDNRPPLRGANPLTKPPKPPFRGSASQPMPPPPPRWATCRGLVTAVEVVRTDRAMLRRERRVTVGKGADLVLAGIVRRPCATEATSEDAAELGRHAVSLGRSFGEDTRSRLVNAMIVAAIEMDTERWSATST